MKFVHAKGILSAQNGMNLYRGCTHGCIYCDSRSTCYQTPIPFEDIEVKENAPQLLEEALKKKRKKCMLGTGAMTDPYLHCEKDIQLTRRCLEIVQKYGFGITIQTKSDLVMRDIEVLKAINQKTKAVLQMTLTTFDDELCKIIEPNVCPTSRRLEVLKAFAKNGIPLVVWLSPFLPFINDTQENLVSLLQACKEVGVTGILNFGIGLTLRDGNREYFYKKLEEHFPGLKQKYIRTYGNAYEVSSRNNYALMKLFYEFCEKNNILHTPNDCFNFLRSFPEKKLQPELF